MDVRDTPLESLGYQQITGLSTAKSITMPAVGPGPVQRTGPRTAFLKAETQAVRWRDDGVDPTATVGNLLDVGDEFPFAGKISKLRFIEVAPSAVLNVTLYS